MKIGTILICTLVLIPSTYVNAWNVSNNLKECTNLLENSKALTLELNALKTQKMQLKDEKKQEALFSSARSVKREEFKKIKVKIRDIEEQIKDINDKGSHMDC